MSAAPDESAPPLTAPRRQALRRDLDELRRTVRRDDAEAYRHLRRMERWSTLCSFAGYATAWIAPNPLSVLLMSQGNVSRWTILAHHIGHRAYDKVPGVARRHTSQGFARGWRRFLDWPDLIEPEAWRFEHNVLHHYHTSEPFDPDLVERNLAPMRRIGAPRVLKYLVLFGIMCTWKWIYYAPNTLWMSRRRRALKKTPDRSTSARLDAVAAEPTRLPYHGAALLSPTSRGGLELWLRCILPYVAYRFVLLPLVFLPLGGWAAASVLVNGLLAELVANVHSFALIVPNHAGSDLSRFEDTVEGRADFYHRQITTSANYQGGSEWGDFLMGYLNYQIEHHLWPDLPASAYRRLSPKVRAICERHGVPYVIEPWSARFRKMVEVSVGDASMRRAPAREDGAEGDARAA